jgi:peptidyl-prolyl cis-trans isomerase D
MLQSIRDGLLNNKKWLAYPLMGLLGVIFVAWGAYGIVSFGVGQTSYAAEAGGQKITAEEARNRWLRVQAQANGAELPPELKVRLQDQILESLIRNALLSERTQDLGYRVSRQDLLAALRNEPAFQSMGEFSPEAAKAVLAQNGITLDRFEEDLSNDLRTRQLEVGVIDSGFATPKELDRVRALQDQEREVRYAVLSPAKFPGTPPDDAAIQAYYKDHQAQFMNPEGARVQYAELRLDALAAQMSVSDAELKASYEKQKNRFQQPERRHARHILITVDKNRDDAAAQKLAQDVLAQLKAGKDFAALAKQYSGDPGSADSGGDLGFQDKSTFAGLDQPFADALFSMSKGELRGPVKTESGYHIIRLDEIEPAKGKSFEEARPELEAQVRKDKATDRFGDLQEQLQSKVEQPGASLDAIASDMKLQVGEVAQYQKGAGGAPLGASPELQSLVFGDQALAAGRLGGPVLQNTAGEERLVIVKVLDRHKAEPKPLAEVRAGIVESLTKERTTEAAYKAAESARARLASGASFEDVVHGLGVTADPARYISRNDPSILPELRDAAFEAPRPVGKPAFQTVKLASGGAAVLAVTQVRVAKLGTPEEQHKKSEQAAEQDGSADWSTYVEQLRATSTVRKNLRVFE